MTYEVFNFDTGLTVESFDNFEEALDFLDSYEDAELCTIMILNESGEEAFFSED